MGLFRKIFGSREAFSPPRFPFSGQVRMIHEDYDRIATDWWNISVQTEDEWETKLAEMRQGIRNHFGRYVTKNGQLLPRWTEETWGFVEIGLRVEKR